LINFFHIKLKKKLVNENKKKKKEKKISHTNFSYKKN
jgi:hypothetical protein